MRTVVVIALVALAGCTEPPPSEVRVAKADPLPPVIEVREFTPQSAWDRRSEIRNGGWRIRLRNLVVAHTFDYRGQTAVVAVDAADPSGIHVQVNSTDAAWVKTITNRKSPFTVEGALVGVASNIWNNANTVFITDAVIVVTAD